MTFWKTWKHMTRTVSVHKLSNYLNLCWQLVLNGSMKTQQERCQRPLLPFVNGYSQSTNIMKNHKLSSQRELNSLKKKLTCQSLNKNWKNPEKNWLSSQINWTNWKKTLKNNLTSKTNLKLKQPRLKRKSTLLKHLSIHFQEKEQDGERVPVKSTTKRKDLSVTLHLQLHSSVIVVHSMLNLESSLLFRNSLKIWSKKTFQS